MSEPAPLLGLAVGETLGGPFEGHLRDSQKLRTWNGSLDSVDWGSATKMATLLARNLVNDGTYNPVSTVSDYVDWYKGGDIRDLDPTIKAALDRVLWGFHWNASGIEHANGHEAALRTAPIGLFFRGDYVTTMDMARCDARLTHRDVESEARAMAVALAVALLSEDLKPQDTLRSVLNLLPDSEFRNSLEKPDQGNDPVRTAFSCLASSTSYLDAVTRAIKLGDKTSATGALTGALAGAYYKLDDIPYVDVIEEGSSIQHLNHLLYVAAPKIDPVT